MPGIERGVKLASGRQRLKRAHGPCLGRRLRYTAAVLPRIMTHSRALAVVLATSFVLVATTIHATEPLPSDGGSVLFDLGFSLSGGPDRNSVSFTKRGLLVPTPWGDIEATIVSTPVDRMVRVPLSPNTDPQVGRLQPYVTAGSRLNVDSDPVLRQARPAAFADNARGGNLKAGAGVILQLDGNVELFGEYHFMRLQRDTTAAFGTTLDTTGFSLGLSVRY